MKDVPFSEQFLESFQILELIGSGAMGQVFRARQKSLERLVAVKILSSNMLGEEELRRRLLVEREASSSLKHENVVALLGFGEDRGRPYLVFELVEGESLRHVLDRERRLTIPHAVRVALAIARGLDEAHRAGIVHRDLKPENILVDTQDTVKIADFGIARIEQIPAGQITASGVIIGTPGYLAPEVIRGEAATSGADIYALGVVLHELLAGQRPFPDGPVVETLLRVITTDSQRLSAQGVIVPAALEELVCSMLARDARVRPDALAVICALASHGEQRDPSRSRPPVRSGNRGNRPGVARTVSLDPGRASRPADTHALGVPPSAARRGLVLAAVLSASLATALLWSGRSPHAIPRPVQTPHPADSLVREPSGPGPDAARPITIAHQLLGAAEADGSVDARDLAGKVIALGARSRDGLRQRARQEAHSWFERRCGLDLDQLVAAVSAVVASPDTGPALKWRLYHAMMDCSDVDAAFELASGAGSGRLQREAIEPLVGFEHAVSGFVATARTTTPPGDGFRLLTRHPSREVQDALRDGALLLFNKHDFVKEASMDLMLETAVDSWDSLQKVARVLELKGGPARSTAAVTYRLGRLPPELAGGGRPLEIILRVASLGIEGSMWVSCGSHRVCLRNDTRSARSEMLILPGRTISSMRNDFAINAATLTALVPADFVSGEHVDLQVKSFPVRPGMAGDRSRTHVFLLDVVLRARPVTIR